MKNPVNLFDSVAHGLMRRGADMPASVAEYVARRVGVETKDVDGVLYVAADDAVRLASVIFNWEISTFGPDSPFDVDLSDFDYLL